MVQRVVKVAAEVLMMVLSSMEAEEAEREELGLLMEEGEEAPGMMLEEVVVVEREARDYLKVAAEVVRAGRDLMMKAEVAVVQVEEELLRSLFVMLVEVEVVFQPLGWPQTKALTAALVAAFSGSPEGLELQGQSRQNRGVEV